MKNALPRIGKCLNHFAMYKYHQLCETGRTKTKQSQEHFGELPTHWHILAIARAPVRRASALILCLHNPLVHRKEAMAKSIRKKCPDTAHQIHHMQSHEIGTGKHTASIRLQKTRPWKCPLCRCNGNKQIWKRAQPYLPAQAAHMIV